jgi:hypothetical protein
MTDKHVKIIDEISSIKSNLLNFQKRLETLNRVLGFKGYTMESPKIKCYNGKGWEETTVNYLNNEKWIRFHLEQEKNLVMGEINKLETRLSKFVNHLQQDLTKLQCANQ